MPKLASSTARQPVSNHVSATLPRVEGPADAELISAVRGGDVDAYGELFARHSDAARRLARQLMSPSDADDLVSDAFTKVLLVLQRGGGPDVAFRAYLLTAVRRLHVDKIRASSRLHTTDDLAPFDPGIPFQDTAIEGFENEAAAKAFASLPERWQLVLWHTEVEGQKPAEVAALLGMSANSVSALAYRAREGLRQAFLNQHAQELEDDTCRWTHQHLGAYIRSGVSRRDAGKVEEHLDECRKCMAIYLELTEVNSNLSGILAPLLLGSAATAYVASIGAGLTKGGLVLVLDRAKDFVSANAPASAVAGVAATAIIAAGTFMSINGNDQQVSSADSAPGSSISTPAPPVAGGPSDRVAETDRADSKVVVVPTVSPTPSDLAEPSETTSTDSPTDDPTEPTDGPTSTESPSSSVSVSPTVTDSPSPTVTDSPSPTVTDSPSPTVTDSPSPTVTDSPSPTVTDSPSPTVTDSPSPTVTDSPSPTVTDSPSPTVAPANLKVTAKVETNGARRYRITAQVSGLAAGGGGTLTVNAGGLDALIDIGSRCTVTSTTFASCTLSGAASEEFQFIVEPTRTLDSIRSILVFTVIPDPGTPDDSTSDNVFVVTLRNDNDRTMPTFGPSNWA